ncbi:vWA domain-containing protein [Butyrivibrio sp. CB08]|uniref:vWA domain-containing protein n=1 Tax=Butyrivibrio sp. CB08 TaxID=2364879 RepID=UPI001FA9EFFC|nr:vWA domain-containing protein [Butyrivibrio sp. CB08]
MNKNLTEIVYILDRSGSMGGLEADTIGGFNAMMEKQKKTGEKALVSTVLFDDVCEVIHDRVPLDKVEEMTGEQYYVRGCTALLDAVGGAIHHIGNVHKYAREEDRPGKTIFVITTDGFENASRKYSREKIEKMVRRKQEKYGWEFIFIGANIDAYAEAQKYGIRKDRAVNYVSDSVGTANVYAGVSAAVCCTLKASAENYHMEMDESGWADEINEDYVRRGGSDAGRRSVLGAGSVPGAGSVLGAGDAAFAGRGRKARR